MKALLAQQNIGGSAWAAQKQRKRGVHRKFSPIKHLVKPVALVILDAIISNLINDKYLEI